MMTSVSCENQIVAVLAMKSAGYGHSSREIRNGERLFVGSDEGSDVCLPDENVASTHCQISAENGRITVRDCYSETGTFVDGNRISETQLDENAELGVGTAVLSVTLKCPESAAAHSEDVSAAVTRNFGKGDLELLSPDTDPPAEEVAQAPDFDASHAELSDLRLQLDQARAEIEVLHSRLATSTAPVPNGDPYEEEMLELLRAEVMDLQAALADQQQAADVSTAGGSQNCVCDDVLPSDDAEKLVGRLEDLLQELQERDEQVAALTELLSLAEETNRAERDERTQLDSWLKDIEERFGCREQEWLAQRDRLQSDIDAIAAERDRAEAAINTDSSNTKLEAAQNVLTALRDTAEGQRQQLVESEKTIAELRHELELAKRVQPREEVVQPREELVQLAEERAELARQRQELELESVRREEQRSGPNEATLKLQVLRQHLKDIHQQEQQEKEERKLGSRISRLWSRIENR
jgi:pSer/pThr/pTyr-binding forkhead associated (FHA) protein